MKYPIAMPNDTGALTLPPAPSPIVMIGTLVGGIAGYSMSKKHWIVGIIIGSSLGGWIGKFANQP